MWKYKQVSIPLNATPDQRQQELDRMGEEGWELKTVHTGLGAKYELLVFARQVPMEQNQDPVARPKQLNG